MKRVYSMVKWLYPGMRVKRWLALMGVGIVLQAVGVYFAVGLHLVHILDRVVLWVERGTSVNLFAFSTYVGVAVALAGFFLVLLAVQRIVRSISEVLVPNRTERLSDLVYRKRYLSHGQRIVVMGGGTGLSTMLRGLKNFSSNLTAVVTVTDDGGSSGRLMREYNVLPPGDIRNCLVALADNEGLMGELFQYRFEGAGEGLRGHSFGNLLLLAMTSVTGSFDEAIRVTSRVLAIRGSVLPSTLSQVSLVGQMDDGQIVHGETAIVECGKQGLIRRLALDPPDPPALAEAVDALTVADAVIIGPGSVYTSVIPNLLVPEIREALRQCKGQRIYVCNVMTQPGESDGFTAADHVKAIEDHGGKGLFDTVLVNTMMPSEDARQRYAVHGANVVQPDIERLTKMGYRAMAADFLNETNLVRHDPQKLADAIVELIT